MASGQWPGADDEGNRGGRVETVDVDELAELKLVGEYKLVLALRKRGVDGVRRVGEFDIEAALRPQVLLVQVSREDVGHLQQRGAPPLSA